MIYPLVVEAAKRHGFTMDNGCVKVEWDDTYQVPLRHGATLDEAKDVLTNFAWGTLTWSMRSRYLGMIRDVFIAARGFYNRQELDNAIWEIENLQV